MKNKNDKRDKSPANFYDRIAEIFDEIERNGVPSKDSRR